MKLLTLFLTFLLFSNLSYSKCNPLFGGKAKPIKDIRNIVFDSGKQLNAIDFDQLTMNDIEKLVKLEFRKAKNKIDKIIKSSEHPTFKNTMRAMDDATENLEGAMGLVGHFSSLDTNEMIKSLEKYQRDIIYPFFSKVNYNKQYFKKIETIYKDSLKSSSLPKDVLKIIKDSYEGMLESGINLAKSEQDKLIAINKSIGELQEKMKDNLLAQKQEMYVSFNEDRAQGLSDYLKNSLQKHAKDLKLKDKYAVRYQDYQYVSVIENSTSPTLREQVYVKSTELGQAGKFNNGDIVKSIVKLRDEKSTLLGFETYAHFVTKKRMAKNPKNVREFLETLIANTESTRQLEATKVIDFYHKSSKANGNLAVWDKIYYGKLLKEKELKYDFEKIKEYLEFDQTLNGILGLVERLYNVKFTEKTYPKWNSDVKTFLLEDNKTGKEIGVFYLDYFSHDTKRGGAWMNSIRSQGINNNEEYVYPLILNSLNIAKPAKGKTLLTPDEAITMLHELGHGLHGLFQNVGINGKGMGGLPWDFIEVPSMFFENFFYNKEFLTSFAKHYETGKVIPTQAIDALVKLKNFEQASQLNNQAKYALLDQVWHSKEGLKIKDIQKFEDDLFQREDWQRKLPRKIMSNSFSHIFTGGYSAGYYSYMWSEALASDNWLYFVENGVFSQEIANKFREMILSRGGTIEPLDAYIAYRGKKPDPNAVLKNYGIVPPEKTDVINNTKITFDLYEAKPIEEIRRLVLNNDNQNNTWALDKLTVDDIGKFAVDAFNKARIELNNLKTSKAIPMWDTFAKHFEKMDDELSYIFSLPLNLSNAIGGKYDALNEQMLVEFGKFKKEIFQDKTIYEKLKIVHDNRLYDELSKEREIYLARQLRRFKKEGFFLDKQGRIRLNEIDAALQSKYSQFSSNLNETKKKLFATFTKDDLEGVPEDVLKLLKAEAVVKALADDQYVLKYLNRDLPPVVMATAKKEATRKKVYDQLGSIGQYKGHDNKPVVKEIAKLRQERATMLGYKSYSHMVIDQDRMVGNPESVIKISKGIQEKAKPFMKKDKESLEVFYRNLVGESAETLKPWNKAYYERLYKKEKYNFDEQELRPYFEFNNTLQAIFDLTETLYDLKSEIVKLPGFSEDSIVVKVIDNKTGKDFAYVYVDPYAKEGKKGGAWMLTMGLQSYEDGVRKIPFVSAVTNFNKPPKGDPSLLTHREVETLAHEWGHAIHGMLSDVELKTMASISGPSDLHETSELMDFSEAPSTFMEHFFSEVEFLQTWAKHNETGKPIPADLVHAMENAKEYGSGAYLHRWGAMNMLDLAWHSDKANTIEDIAKLEKDLFGRSDEEAKYVKSLMSSTIGHYFSTSEYAAGYYVYMYSEIISSALYDHIKTNGLLYDKEFFQKFRDTMLSQGTVMEPLKAYKELTGNEPDQSAILRLMGLKLD